MRSTVGSNQFAVDQRSAQKSLWFYLLFWFCLLFSSCFQPENGCLDIEATNFTPSADESCGNDDSTTGCPCKYPNLSLKIDYNFLPLEKIPEDFYLNDSLAQLYDYIPDSVYEINNQQIRLKSIHFYLSNFQFHQQNGDWLNVEDTITLVINENDPKDSLFIDNFQLINEEQTSITLGAVRQSGTYDSLQFLVGLAMQANKVLPDSISDTDHPLAQTAFNTGDFSDGSYIFNQITFQKDTFPNSLITVLNVTGNTSFVTIKLPFSYETPIGANFSIGTLRINHAKWFDGINFVADNDAVMIDAIVANTPNVFSISN